MKYIFFYVVVIEPRAITLKRQQWNGVSLAIEINKKYLNV